MGAHSRAEENLAVKKRISNERSGPKRIRGVTAMTIGMDLGDKTSRYCMIDSNGEILSEQYEEVFSVNLPR